MRLRGRALSCGSYFVFGGQGVYYTDGRIFAPFAAALAVQFFMNLLEKFRPAENKEINYDNAETLD